MSYRYRLYPTEVQEQVMRRHCADARFVWNLALEQANLWRPGRPSPNAAERGRQLTEARAGSWLGEGSSNVQREALRDFERALKNWWGGSHRRPTWRKAARNEGYCIRDVVVERLNKKWATVHVPKLGPVKFRLSRPLPAKYGMGRVTLDRSGRWHVSFSTLQPTIDRKPSGSAVGIDRGVATTIATSDGQMLRIPSCPKQQAKIERLQRQMARQKKGSNRRAKTCLELAKTHARITDRRKDWVEKQTTRLVRDHDVIMLERLNTSGMVRRPKQKPDVAKPGEFLRNGAAAKAGLNRSIQRSCWGLFERRLTDKANVSGVTVLFVDPRNTSRECNKCGHTAKESRESQAVFRCVECGHTAHADRNAALNILARGFGSAHAPGDGASARVNPSQTVAGTTREESRVSGNRIGESHV